MCSQIEIEKENLADFDGFQQKINKIKKGRGEGRKKKKKKKKNRKPVSDFVKKKNRGGCSFVDLYERKKEEALDNFTSCFFSFGLYPFVEPLFGVGFSKIMNFSYEKNKETKKKQLQLL